MNQKHIDPVSGKTLRELADETGLLYSTLFIRFKRGWTGEKLIQQNHGCEKLFMGKTFREWSRELSTQYGVKISPRDVRHFIWSSRYFGDLPDKKIMQRLRKSLRLNEKRPYQRRVGKE